MGNTAKGVLCILASAFGFAMMGFSVRLCDNYGDAISPFQKSFFRNIVALAIAAVVLVRHHRVQGLEFKARGLPLLLLRCVAGVLGIFANFYALSRIPIGEAMCLNKTAPFFTILFTFIFFGERMDLKRIVLLCAAFVGAALVARPGYREMGSFAALCGLFGGLSAGLAYTCVRRLGTMGVDAAVIVFVFSAFSTIVSLPFMIGPAYTPMTLTQLLILLGAGAGASAGQFGVTCAYRFAPPSRIAVYDYSNIVFSAALGFAFLGQIPDIVAIVGFVLIVASATLSSRVHIQD